MKKNNTGVLLLLLTLFAAVVCAVSAYLLSHVPLIWQVSLGVMVVAGIGYVAVDRKQIGTVLGKKSTRYGLNSVFMSLIAFAIVVVLNMIAVNHDIKKDVTKGHLHTLSEQSIKVVKGLKSEVKLRAFVSPMQIQDFDKAFDKYTYHSPMLKKEYVDVDKDPFAVQKYGIKQTGTVIVESATRSARVDGLSGADDPKLEEKLTNAIIQVEKGDKKKIYFLTGHGERLLSDTGREGYFEIKESLESGRYNVAELSLLDKERVPADAEILICAGPKSDFMEPELKMLETYIRSGGHALLMVEPNSTETIKPLLAKFGADWHSKKAVLETNRLQQLAGGNPLTPIVTAYDPTQEITRDLKQLSIYPIATPIEKAATIPPGLTVGSLFSTSNKSLEVQLQGDKVAVDEKKDRKGPISLALAISGKVEKAAAPEKDKDKDKKDPKAAEAEKKDADFRLVVVGDSDFASNSVRKFGINADLFQNMLSWLSKEEDLISIRPKAADSSDFEITEERARIINLASIVVAPFLLFLSGISVWLSRRRR